MPEAQMPPIKTRAEIKQALDDCDGALKLIEQIHSPELKTMSKYGINQKREVLLWVLGETEEI